MVEATAENTVVDATKDNSVVEATVENSVVEASPESANSYTGEGLCYFINSSSWLRQAY